MARVQFLPAAQCELIEARDWYAARGARLVEAFIVELDRQVARIEEAPLEFPIIMADVRRALLRTFPYGLFFRVLDDDAFIIACFHASRDPRIWQGRIGG